MTRADGIRNLSPAERAEFRRASRDVEHVAAELHDLAQWVLTDIRPGLEHGMNQVDNAVQQVTALADGLVKTAKVLYDTEAA